jgi:hypothetical protein
MNDLARSQLLTILFLSDNFFGGERSHLILRISEAKHTRAADMEENEMGAACFVHSE